MKRRNFVNLMGGSTPLLLLSSCDGGINRKDHGEQKTGQLPFAFKNISRSIPTADDLLQYYERFNNWGRWGKEDKFGTLNFIDEQAVRNAKELISVGRSVTLSRPMTSGKLEMEIYSTNSDNIGSAHDTITVHGHGYTETHIDALNHISSKDGKLYNGYSESLITEKGALIHGIENWKNGIITRGVLYDITKLRELPFIPVDQPVQGWELEDFARKHKVEPRKGDAAIIHCGRNAFFQYHPDNPNTLGNKPGLNPSVLEFIHAYNAALMGSDFDEAPNNDKRYPTNYSIHHVANPFMGLPTLWNLDLGVLSKICIDRNTWEFFLVLAPLVVVGGTGSVVNPIAIM
ncbi:MAG: cyclase family protein [Saprospiraceae bacterium]|nr:cyclase family protein [Saprospiraceae bacterium]